MAPSSKIKDVARIAGAVAVFLAGGFYCYAVWRGVNWAWVHGFRFYASELITAEAVRDGVHCFFLAIAVFLFSRFAGLGAPSVRKAGWPLAGYGVLIALAVAAVAAVRIYPGFTNPFTGHGPFFFTLGPAAWEVMWPGVIYGFAVAAAGPERGVTADRVLTVAGTLTSTAYYVPLFIGMRPYDKIAFVAVTLAMNFFSFNLRRRTGSVWMGMAGHLLVKFVLTW